jgi:CelD/BcsL family acetyltransferase involved in cellulose biosynthesis
VVRPGDERAPGVVVGAPGDAAVLAAWQDLQADGAVRSPFLTWQWAAAFGAVPAVAAEVRVLRVVDGGRTLGLLPVETWRDPTGLRALGPAGGRWLGPDHLDVVARDADRDAVATAVVRHLTRTRGWDLLDLEGITGALAVATARSGPRALRLPDRAVVSPTLDLRPREPALLLPSRNLRQQVSRGLRVAEREGGGLQVCTSPDDVTAALRVLMDLHNTRFGERSAVFATPDRRRFHLEVAGRLAEDGLARVYRLRVGEKDAALLYALRLGGTLYYYSMGMQPDLGSSPGRTLLGQVALAAAAEGLDEFDLLRGEHGFKLRFASGTQEDLHRRLLRPSPRVLPVLARRAPGAVLGRLRARRDTPAAEAGDAED